MNKSDSERVAAFLERKGYKQVLKINEADLIVVNMCSVRQSAVDRVLGLTKKFKELRNKNHKLKTILTGCVLKKDKTKFAKIFDSVVGIKNLLEKEDYLKIKPKYQSSFLAEVPIMTGCNNFCAYCVVPYTRGKEIARPAQEIICEVKNLIKNGYKEIWLLGQNVNSYQNNKVNFPKLLKMISKIRGKFWIRFTSPHPKDFSNELIEVMVKSKKITPYLNLPVQSGDDTVLKRMNRNYTTAQYKNLVKKIRDRIPEITLSTDVIVGFPGETKKQFENTVKLFKEIKYDMAYISKYSPRAGTAAAKMKNNVSPKEKERRFKVLNEILKKTALENNKKFIGKILEVLAKEAKKSFLIGKSWQYKTVKFKGSQNLIGKFVKVKIVDVTPYGLSGEIC